MCTGILSYVTQYDRYYCFRCNAYPPEGVFMDTKVEPAASPTPPISEPATTSQTALVVVEPPKAEEPEPIQVEPEPKAVSVGEEPKTVSVDQEANAVFSEERAEPAPVLAAGPTLQAVPEARAEEEISQEEPAPPVAKPALVRAEIREAKKPVLMDLCKAYGLDPSGTKEQLRERLLSYLDDSEAKRRPGTSPMEIPIVFPQAAEESATPPTQAEPVTEPKPAPRMMFTAAPRMIPEAAKKVVDAFRQADAAIAPVAVDTAASTSGDVQALVVPAVAATPTPEVVTGPPTIPTAKVEHPCPTCGRALTYIQQYNRWYCYSCRAYAPKTRSKFACPTCGAALRWIPQYERWWCDGCRKYAPSDLPKPERTSIVGTSAAAVARGASVAAATIVHRHRSPGSGIGLVGFGMVLFVLYEVLVDLPVALSTGTASLLAPDVAFGLRFFAFVFVAVGAIMGLYAVRDRR